MATLVDEHIPSVEHPTDLQVLTVVATPNIPANLPRPVEPIPIPTNQQHQPSAVTTTTTTTVVTQPLPVPPSPVTLPKSSTPQQSSPPDHENQVSSSLVDPMETLRLQIITIKFNQIQEYGVITRRLDKILDKLRLLPPTELTPGVIEIGNMIAGFKREIMTTTIPKIPTPSLSVLEKLDIPASKAM